ncbi:hypothetical protein C2S52_015856 [Perilla frutescens var. hirtella]|nr:hypothetical protein C2S52_015856 [Perilla frutescens var. hirtella]
MHLATKRSNKAFLDSIPCVKSIADQSTINLDHQHLPLIQDVKLHAIIDSCHSGTVLDLPQVYDITTGKWEDNSPPSGAYKGTKGGIAICFSACEDYQLAANTSAFSPEKEMTGAMTITFILAVKAALDKNESITYQDIMDSMHQTIKQASKSGGFFAGIRRFFHRRILQVLHRNLLSLIECNHVCSSH